MDPLQTIGKAGHSGPTPRIAVGHQSSHFDRFLHPTDPFCRIKSESGRVILETGTGKVFMMEVELLFEISHRTRDDLN